MNAFSLPSFEGSKCRLLSVCADLPKAKPFMGSIEKSGPYVASYRASKGKAHVRLACHDVSLHIDIAAPGCFEKRKPRETYTIGKLKETLGKTDEVEVPVRVTGRFSVPLSSLPVNGLVRSFLGKREVGKVAVSLTEAKFEFKGSNVNYVRWELTEEDGGAEIVVQIQTRRKIRGEYFIESLRDIERAFNNIILERQQTSGEAKARV